VFGCLLAGFYLLLVYDMSVATYEAVAINLVVGVIGLTAAQFSRGGVNKQNARLETAGAFAGPKIIYVVIALSGFTGLGAEVIWTRLLSLMLGGTVYTFSIILA